jgi:hypothetical protein
VVLLGPRLVVRLRLSDLLLLRLVLDGSQLLISGVAVHKGLLFLRLELRNPLFLFRSLCFYVSFLVRAI